VEVAFVDRLVPMLVHGDTEGAWELLHSLEGEDLRNARDWFAGAKRWFNSLHELDYVAETSEERHKNWSEARWIVGMCALVLCGPVTAARRVPWSWLWDFKQDAGEAAFVHMLWDAEPAWVADFVDAASNVSLGRNARNVNGTLSRVLRAATLHHGLPCPSGRTFLAEWLAGTGEGEPVERLARDPLMPALLFHYLASGHCGRSHWLPQVVAELVQDGQVDRTALIEHALDLLTAPQRPASQQVLASIVAVLELRAGEIPGGLTFVLGVMSTSTGGVGRVLLPRAIELVADADGLLELTSVVAGRPERKQKEVLLTALRSASFSAAVGAEHVHEALRRLGTDDDAAFSDEVARAARALGADTTAQPVPAATGLWNLPPAPSGMDHSPRRWRSGRSPSWGDFLDAACKPESVDHPWLVDRTLGLMQAGDFKDGAILRNPATRLLAQGILALPRLTSALSDLFLAGGLRQGWPVAMAVAAAICRTPRQPAGLPKFFRMLASYAGEVPQQQLPSDVAAFAAGAGRTKTRMEAQRIGANLARLDVDSLVRQLRETPPAADPPEVRGLWRTGGSAQQPSPAQFAEPTLDLDTLRRAVKADLYPRHVVNLGKGPSGLTYPDLVLGAVVRAIHEHGAPAVRQALRGIERPYEPTSVIAAIDLWVATPLDVPAFWRLARQARTLCEAMREWTQAGSVSRPEFAMRQGALQHLAAALNAQPPATEPLVLPAALSADLARLSFLRACESLLSATETPVVLSTPAYADGSLDFDRLLGRLKAMYGAPVGPLDLVQALHRLRPVDSGRLAELDFGPMPTAAALTHPDGGKTWDAVEIVRTWVASGGLPALAPVAEGGVWSTKSVAPVPWSLLEAAPVAVREDPWFLDTPSDRISVTPFWGDRTVRQAFQLLAHFDQRGAPGALGGQFGLPLHDHVLAILTVTDRRQYSAAFEAISVVVRQERLDPQIAARAAVGRHEAGSLALGRLIAMFAALFDDGGLRGLWHSALAIAAALCEVSAKPLELPDLLRMLTAYAHEVPKPAVPEPLRRFAGEHGSSRSHVAARALVGALERT
jgi:hypothetical protein